MSKVEPYVYRCQNEHVVCGDCRYFRRVDHPHLGTCDAGEPLNPAGLWDADRRWCSEYKATVTARCNRYLDSIGETHEQTRVEFIELANARWRRK